MDKNFKKIRVTFIATGESFTGKTYKEVGDKLRKRDGSLPPTIEDYMVNARDRYYNFGVISSKDEIDMSNIKNFILSLKRIGRLNIEYFDTDDIPRPNNVTDFNKYR